jgi:hypothetical protein
VLQGGESASGLFVLMGGGVIQPPRRLGGVATSRSLFVATPPFILRYCDVYRVGNGFKPFLTTLSTTAINSCF